MISKLKSMIGHRSPIRLAWHHGKSLLAALRYGFPARELTVIGITGTDGKTTTVGMLTHILLRNNYKVGAASTAFLQINEEKRENVTHLTSISPFTLQKFLKELVTTGCTHAVIEVSSHGLVQGRTAWTYPKVAAITNIASEHLDYHGSMKQYIADKALLFRMLKGKGIKVLNRSDETHNHYTPIPSSATLTYSTKQHDVDLSASDISASINACSAELSTGDTLKLSVPGVFNVDNALCAISCANALGISVSDAVTALQDFEAIPGRMERIDEGQNFSVYVDFNVSLQSYERTLETLRKVAGENGRVLVLCSSCGDRMKEKRPLIGQLCSRLADVVVATEDETYGEDPHAVLEEVWAGIDQNTCEAHKIFDRREAITFLFNEAKSGDAIVLSGMGPFSTMNKLEGQVEWDERKVARELLHSL